MDIKTPPKNSSELRNFAWSLLVYNSSSILGPLLIIGGIGYFLDYKLGTKPLFIIIGVIVAFITTNIFLFLRLKKYSKELEKIAPKKDVEKEGNNTN